MTKNEEFAELLRTYGDTAYRMAYQLAGGREDEARDLVQDVFLQIWRHWDVHRPTHFKGWLYRLLRNLYVDHWRSRNRHPVLSLDAPISGASNADGDGSEGVWQQTLADGEATPPARAEGAELQQKVREALGRLDEDFRIAVSLCDLEGLSYEEIAQVMACPVGTVRSRVSRGRAQLRSLLGQFDLGVVL